MTTDPVESLERWAGAISTLFVFAFGACAGSLINVLAYRMPLGLSVVSPPSRCPSCHTRLTWRENIPIFGWLLLRGRCRFCRSRISPEYPIVEAFVASLWAFVYVLWFFLPPHGTWPHHQTAMFLGFDWGTLKPEWAIGGLAQCWPLFVMTLIMLGALVAMTLCDARTYMIPLQLAWTPGIVGILAHGGWGLWLHLKQANLAAAGRARPIMERIEQGWTWAIPSPAAWGGSGWWMVGAALGGVLGLGIANVLVSMGLIRRSFADYQAWEDSVRPKEKPWGPTWANCCPAVAAELPEAPAPASPEAPPAIAPAGTPVADRDGSPADMWLDYPHARREMFKELCFLSPVVTLAVLGGWLAMRWYGGNAGGSLPATPLAAIPPAHVIPVWLDALTASLFGMLVGGGVVWLVRLLGTIGFGKEALGLGDVHLMAGVGACVGFIDASFAFLLSAFVGLAITAVGAVLRGKANRALPLGPSLAVATALVVLGKVFLERGLAIVAPNLAPIHLP